MEKVFEINIDREDIKNYLEESLKEENIDYKIKIEGRWHQKYKQASEYYDVYCVYVNNDNINRVQELMNEFENAKVITEDIEELKNIEEDENLKKFNQKSFLKYYWGAIIIIGILIIIGIKFTT